MRIKNYLIFLSSVGLLAGGSWYAALDSGFMPKSASWQAEAEEEEEEGKEIAGALKSKYALRLNEVTGTIEPEWVTASLDQANNRLVRRLNKPIVWEGMGPDNVGGRTRAFLMDKDSAHLMFLGSVSGGLFRSFTFGNSWSPVNDQEENLNVTCIAQTIDGTIFYGTGEGGFTNLFGTRNGSPAFLGNGIYKSSNRSGTAFERLNVTKTDTRFYTCNSMASHPTQNKLYVGTESGLFVSDNGGNSFTLVRGGAAKEVKIDGNGVIWANIGNAVYKSDANGANMALVNFGAGATAGRTAIAISPQDPNYVYLLVAKTDGFLLGMWQTKDGGSNWSQVVFSNSTTEIYGTGQGWYDNVVGVHPNNKELVYMGGVTMAAWDPTNGFREIASMFNAPWNTGFVHADKHIITWNTRTSPPTLIVGTDGGLYFSQNSSVFTPKSRGFTTLQLYNVAANSLGHVTGGSQDNGTQLLNFTGNTNPGSPESRAAVEITGGDGFDVEFSRHDPRKIFTSTYYGIIYRTANSGQAISTFWDSRIKPDPAAANPPNSDFNTQFTLWEDATGDNSRLFLAKNQDVWVAINPTNFNQTVNWFLVSSGLGNDRIIETDVTPDGNHLFICKQGRLFRVDSLNSANFSTSAYPAARAIPAPIITKNITSNLPGGRAVTSVNVDQSNPNHIVVTLGGYGNTSYVFESNNALDETPTFTNITGNLPRIPVYDAVIDVDDPDRIILGTDLGIWATEDGGTNWEEANEGMARVAVFEIRGYEFKPWEGMVMYIGTHGRGYYRSNTLLTSTKKASLQKGSLKTYPSPAVDQVNVSFNLNKTSTVKLEVYDINGKLMEVRNVNGNVGANTVQIDTRAFTRGYYFAKISTQEETRTSKFMVMK